MTWNDRRRKGWIRERPRTAPPAAPEPKPPGPLVIPAQPTFSEADVAYLLNKQQSLVQWWITNGKLDSRLDFRGRRYVTREELVAFVQRYLGLTVS
ncbi:hypothetical protein [Candidatus Nitrospira bockiana]